MGKTIEVKKYVPGKNAKKAGEKVIQGIKKSD
jgi:hypothetical protein